MIAMEDSNGTTSGKTAWGLTYIMYLEFHIITDVLISGHKHMLKIVYYHVYLSYLHGHFNYLTTRVLKLYYLSMGLKDYWTIGKQCKPWSDAAFCNAWLGLHCLHLPYI